jgi:hypothetical protein
MAELAFIVLGEQKYKIKKFGGHILIFFFLN